MYVGVGLYVSTQARRVAFARFGGRLSIASKDCSPALCPLLLSFSDRWLLLLLLLYVSTHAGSPAPVCFARAGGRPLLFCAQDFIVKHRDKIPTGVPIVVCW